LVACEQPAGQNSTTITILLVDDNTGEPTEDFTVVLSNPTGAMITDGTGMVTILDDDAAMPSLTIGDITVDENNGNAILTITSSMVSTTPISVTYTTNNGTALNGADYTPTNATVIIPAGQTSVTAIVPLVDDNAPEPTEDFTVTLSNPTGAMIADGTAIVTIMDDDMVTPTISIADKMVDEDDGQVVLRISLSTPLAAPTTVVYTTFEGTAESPEDYTATTATAIIPIGQTFVDVTIPLMNDNVPEPEEFFTVLLSNPMGAVLGNATGIVTITDMDVTPTVSIADKMVDEDEGEVVLTISLSAPSTDPTTVVYTTFEGTAESPDDYTATTATATIPAGQTSVDVTIPLVNDNVPEPEEFFNVVLSNPMGAILGNATAIVTINDMDVDPCIDLGGDTDGDGVCDDEDCKPNDPNFPAAPGTPCNDGNPNTINDIVSGNGCGCAGDFIGNPVCIDFHPYYEEYFEEDLGNWIDGGSQAEHYAIGANGSGYGVRLRDNDGVGSSIYTYPMDLSGVSRVKINFMVRFDDMEHGEDLYLEYSSNGGASYQVAQRWISGQNISNSNYYSNEEIELSGSFNSNMVFRFRCDASSSLDRVYLDEIKISNCIVNSDPFAGQRPVYRTLDGSFNNFDFDEYGKTNSSMVRRVPAAYGDGVGSLSGQNRPSARHISNQLSDEPQDRRDERLLSGMAYQFGQFIDHDFVFAAGGGEFAPIQVPNYDPVFAGNGTIPFSRSLGTQGVTGRENANKITAYIDASQVYGVEEDRANWLRSFVDGKLRTSKGNMLPFNTTDGEFESPHDPTAPRMERDQERNGTFRKLFVAGDFRANEHPNLLSFQTIFMREHNRLCDQLKSQGFTDDEEIYQKARKLVGALMQKVTYDEFIPAFGVSLSPYTGYKPNVNPGVSHVFAVAAYRWHTMVENDIILRNDACEGIGPVELPLKTIFSNPSIIQKFGPGLLLQGLSFHPQYRTDLKVNNGLRNFLFGQGQGLDIVSINLQRGRDHGLPDYNTVRQHYGFGSVSSFSQINSDHEISGRLQSAYGDINDIDLWAGIFAEPLVSGTSLPATAIAIMKEQFEAMRDGDAYFYKIDPAISSSDMSFINSSSLKDIIERNSSAKNLPSNVFFKPPCSDEDPLEDLNDQGAPVCDSHGATFMTSCSSTSGSNYNVGNYYAVSSVRKIKVKLGYGVRIFNNQGESAYYTDDIECLPTSFRGGNINSIQVICLSDDPSTVDCTGFAGALYDGCFSSPLPILSPGDYNTEQLKSLSVSDNMVSAIRVNNGFRVSLYSDDNFQGTVQHYTGPTVLCLPSTMRNRVSSMKVVCLSDPNFSNCGFNGVAGAIFQKDVDDVDAHIGVSVGPGDYDTQRMIAMGAGDDNTKRVAVNNGYAITLFNEDNFQGAHRVFLGDESDLSTSFTEIRYHSWDILRLHGYEVTDVVELSVSSMRVTCIESLQTFAIAPEHIINFIADKDEGKVRLTIAHHLAKEAELLTVEKFDGRTGEFEFFEEISVENKTASYTMLDEHPLDGDNVYRVIVQYADGEQEETPYRTVRFEKPTVFNVFPNPAMDIVNVDLTDYLEMEVDVRIYDMLGVEIQAKQFEMLSTPIVSFDISENLSGNYLIRVTPNDKKPVSKMFSVIRN